MAKVTYVPRPGDPTTTNWRGREFQAGKSVDITDTEYLDHALTNPWFKVEGYDKPVPVKGMLDPEVSAAAVKASNDAAKAADDAAKAKAALAKSAEDEARAKAADNKAAEAKANPDPNRKW